MTLPVSGPGKFSQRTDRQPIRTPTGLPYGEAGALTQSQRDAPLAASPEPPAAVPFTAPSMQPGQPVTAGAAAGPGPGHEVLGPQPVGLPSGGAVSQAIARAAAQDTSGDLAQLLQIALSKGL